MSLSIRVVGVGDAFTARYYNACLLVEAKGTRLLIDAPPALARALRDLGSRGGEVVSLDDIDHVLITHLHGDHVGGVEQLLFWRRFVTRRKCSLYAIPDVLAGLWNERLRGAMSALRTPSGDAYSLTLDDYCDVRPLPSSPRDSLSLGPLSIEWRPTVHHIPTSALRITCDGRSFGYSADTAFDPTLIEWLSRADLVVHETNLGVHTPIERLVDLDAPLRARMRLIHYPDWHDVDATEIASAREGDRYDL